MKKILALVIAAVMLLSVTSCSPKDLGWPEDDELISLIPELEGIVVDYKSYSSESDVHVRVNDKNDYTGYIKDLEKAGFDVDADKSDGNYTAYNHDGYKVTAFYFSSKNEVDISVYDIVEYGELKWPGGYLAGLLPVPESTKGEINLDSSDHLSVSVADTSESAFDEYVDKCIGKGFDVDYSKDDGYFRAENSKGDKLTVEYEGMNVMSISVYRHDDETTKATEKQTEAPKPETTAAPVTEPPATEPPVTEPPVTQAPETQAPNSVDWREFLREYEALIDEYVTFYKEYMANPTDLTLLGKYTEWLGKLNEWSEKSIEVQGLVSLAEVNEYVAEVNRITAKLSDLY